MNTRTSFHPRAWALLCASCMMAAAQAPAVKHPAARTGPVDEAAPPVSASARAVSYSDQDVMTIKTRVRYTTLIVLPKNEQILDFTVGDKEFWIIEGNENLAYVKPARAGAQTDLNLVTASGNIYSFLLSEVSERANAEADLKVFVELKDDRMLAAAKGAPRFVAAQDVEAVKRDLDKANAEIRQNKDSAQAAINQGISRFVFNVRFSYRFEAGKKPFNVRAMYHDDRFTYIQARPEETPSLYEIKDGQPNLVNFDYRNGVYVVDKILDRGYLVIGKQKWGFTREE
jgi:type IV secretory pathway VirB9-like protein